MAELIAAAASPVIEILVEKLKSEFLKQLGLARSVYTDMEKLQNKLSKIQDVLDDVEGKPITSKALQGTLRKLRDAALDAEDVLEEFETEALRRRMERHEHMTGKVRDFFSSNNPIAFRCKMARKMKEIREGFDEIVEDNRDFNSMVNSVSNLIKKKSDSDWSMDRETNSLMVEPEIYGRAEDEKVVMNFLVDSDKNISILAIVGLGGVGKTTLAQSVYNNETIKEQFELRMWVCVGETFDIQMVLRAMIEQVKGEQSIFSTFETLSISLDEKLRPKRFLLVLDDLWSDKKSEWEKLKPLFTHSKLGSKIIVTTRIHTVASAASTIGTVSVHELRRLQDDDCWTLFKKRAFGSEREEDYPELVEIGREIIKNCGGLPLAAKALGSLMSSKREKDEWLDIKNNEIWKSSEDEIGILPALKLSYDHLPSHLKRCFMYCSVFPKDHEFKIKRLIQLWMAEGLIDTSDISLNAEDIGKKYFKNLLWRSFFQDVKMDWYNNPVTCKMHDLVHDLACSITKDEALVMKGDTESISHGCRYLSVTYSHASSIDLKTTYEAKKLRSLILLGAPCVDEFIYNITKAFTRLHTLDLSRSRIEKLPDSISRLKHLRFLDLSHTKITTLPTWITRLYNLQTLNLLKCGDLKELPEGISNLCNLRHMDISWCTRITTLPTSITQLCSLQSLKLEGCYNLRELPEGISNLGNLRHLDISECSSLSCIPRGLGQLSDLETLPTFIVAQENGCTIAELQHLNSIRGRLVIKNLYHVKDPNEAMQANLRAKTRLNCLRLQWDGGLNEETEVEKAEGVFERLQPHQNLKELEISYYIGIRLPNWMSYGDGGDIIFPLLEDLDLSDMPNLEKWHTEPTVAGRKTASFPGLTRLYIESCPKLVAQPCIPCSVESLEIISSNEILLSAGSLAGLSKLTCLNIERCGVSSSSGWWDGLQYLTVLEELRIKKCDELTCLPKDIMYLPSLYWFELSGNRNMSLEGGGRKQQPTPFFMALRHLKIKGVDVLTALPEWVGGLTSLQHLQINDCPNLTMLPCNLQHHTALQKLHISNLPQLSMLPDGLQHLTALKNLDISDLSQLSMLPDGLWHLTALQNLYITNLPQLTMLPDGLQHLTTLKSLSISNLPQLSMLPDGLQHLTALKSLFISNLPQLSILPNGLRHLAALHYLKIDTCTQLLMLPDDLQHLTTLEFLRIISCPQLKRRCKRKTGKDWHKIAHIPNIDIL